MKILNHEFKHPYLDVVAVLLLIVLTGGSAFGYISYRRAEEAKAELAAKKRGEQQAVRSFESLEEKHNEYIALVYDIDVTLMQAKSKIENNLAAQEAWDDEWDSRQAAYKQEVDTVRAHNEAEDAKYLNDPRYTQRDYWPAPAFPVMPGSLSVEFSAEISALNAQSAQLKTWLGKLKKDSSDFSSEEIKPIYRALLNSGEELKSALNRDIDILNKIVTDEDKGQVVSSAKADLMKYNAEDDGLKRFHAKALAFVKNHGLDLKDFELPGGADTKPEDKSNLK